MYSSSLCRYALPAWYQVGSGCQVGRRRLQRTADCVFSRLSGSRVPNGNRVPGGEKKRPRVRTLHVRAFSPLVFSRWATAWKRSLTRTQGFLSLPCSPCFFPAFLLFFFTCLWLVLSLSPPPLFFPSPFSRFGVFQVEYHVETFCDKNKDELPKESDELFASSPNPFVTNLFAPAGGAKS